MLLRLSLFPVSNLEDFFLTSGEINAYCEKTVWTKSARRRETLSGAAQKRMAQTIQSLSTSSCTAAKVCNKYLPSPNFAVPYLRAITDARTFVEALKQLCIIERTPSPTPTLTPIPLLRRLARIPVRGHNATLQAQLARMQVEMARIQALLMPNSNDWNRTIKQEETESGDFSGSSKHVSKRAKTNNGEVEVIVIDDSDDDTSLFVPL